jgi:hypothetical protein
MKTKRKKNLQYIPGAADDGLGFFPAITCQIMGEGPPRVRWVVQHRRRQFHSKKEALASANAEIALAFEDSTLPSSAERFLDHLRQRGFSELMDYRVAKTFEEDRRSVLGDDFQPAFGEAAARRDPVLHASIMEIVNRQIAERNPPEARETFERLLAEGYSPEHIRRMIGLLVARGITETLMRQKPFDVNRYSELLRRLPEIPPP